MKPVRKRNRVKGTIAVIASLLLGSAVLRIALGANQVMAESKDIEMSGLKATDTSENTPLPTSKLLQAIMQREKRATLKEQELAERKKALDVAKVEIERRLEALEKAEALLSATLAKANTAADDDVTQLIQVYESMKPKDTAALFETMEPAFAAGFLGRMRPEAAAGIMAGLSPQVAYTISVILAGRNANAPKN